MLSAWRNIHENPVSTVFMFQCLCFPPPLTCKEVSCFLIFDNPTTTNWIRVRGEVNKILYIHARGMWKDQQSVGPVIRSVKEWHWQPRRHDKPSTEKKGVWLRICELDPKFNQVLVPWAWWFSGTSEDKGCEAT